jgi:hypothetical protein
MARTSNEFFYIDETTGEASDADLHAELLDNIDPAVERALLEATRRELLAKGYDPAFIAKHYSFEEEPSPSPEATDRGDKR